MFASLLVFASALWLGLLTSISPCPLATNVAAIGFLSKELAQARRVLAIGLAYTFGRTLSYIVLAVILAFALDSAPLVSQGLQSYGNKILGPLLIVVGMILLEVVSLPSFSILKPKGNVSQWQQNYRGNLGGFLLGLIFALSFCPVSAALFFGSLLPLSTSSQSPVLVPLFYGLGTAAPVLAMAILLSLGLRYAARALNQLKALERWARPMTGVIFLVIGVYYCLIYLWGMGDFFA